MSGMCVNSEITDEIRRGGLILFVASIIVGACAGPIESAMILSDETKTQIFSEAWPISLIGGVDFFEFDEEKPR